MTIRKATINLLDAIIENTESKKIIDYPTKNADQITTFINLQYINEEVADLVEAVIKERTK